MVHNVNAGVHSCYCTVHTHYFKPPDGNVSLPYQCMPQPSTKSSFPEINETHHNTSQGLSNLLEFSQSSISRLWLVLLEASPLGNDNTVGCDWDHMASV